jgi:hypothetical protein
MGKVTVIWVTHPDDPIYKEGPRYFFPRAAPGLLRYEADLRRRRRAELLSTTATAKDDEHSDDRS